MSILFFEIAHCAKYLNTRIVGKRNAAKKFLKNVTIAFKKYQRAYKKMENIYFQSFFYDVEYETLLVYIMYKKVPMCIQVKWRKDKPCGLSYACDMPLPQAITQWLNRLLTYNIPTGGVNDKKSLCLISKNLRKTITDILYNIA